MVPLWTPSALGALPAFFTRPRRLKPNQCPCGYPLTGLSTYACPECGTPVSPVPSPSTPSAEAPSDPRKEAAP